MMALSRTLPVVYIEWEDSARAEGWRDGINKLPSIIETVGLRLHHDKKVVVVTHSISDEGHVLSQITIPRNSIRKMKELLKIMQGGKAA